jgi:2-keto-4-pentenoate hydratase/2-oxohepta-3-ene-1,7-dioic acid hydratase in catechol pathway
LPTPEEASVKLVYFDQEQLGVLTDAGVIDVTDVVKELPSYPYGQRIKEVIDHWDALKADIEASARERRATPLSSVKLLPPIPKPDKILCVGLNYFDTPDRAPAVLDAFDKNSDSVSGDGDEILIPPYDDIPLQSVGPQPEPEFAFVIGKTGRFVSQDDALDHIFGYLISVDFSLRRKVRAPYPTMFTAKSCQGFLPIGPAIVTPDEVPDPYDIQITLSVNGTETGYNTRDMQHKLPAIVEFLSKVTTLRPGDIVTCGNHHDSLQTVMDGDRVVVSMERLGPPLHFTIRDPLRRQFSRERGHPNRRAATGSPSGEKG